MNLKPSRPTVSVLILIALSSFLLLLRIQKTSSPLGFSLGWNLFLAVTPLFFILLAKKIYSNVAFKTLKSKISIFSLMLTWLLFFPNSPYIITDLIHLNRLPKHLLWFDSISIFLTALTGLVVGLYSLFNFQVLSSNIFGKITAWFLVIGSLILSGFGLYLGRFARFNSWDLFVKPFDLIKKSMAAATTPLAFQTTIIFSVVLIGLYLSFYNLISFKHASAKNASKL